MSCCRDDDVIWVHDYHLIPLAKMLRERGHRNRIGFFLHIPCPPPEILTALPNHESLIPQLGDYDLVGFQTEDDANNCARYFEYECGYRPLSGFRFQTPDRQTRIGVFPIGIETADVQPDGAALGPLADGAQRRRQPVRSRDDHRRRPARLLQGAWRSASMLTSGFWRSIRTGATRCTYLQITPKSRSEISEYVGHGARGQHRGRTDQRHLRRSWRGRRSATSTRPTAARRWPAFTALRASALVTPLRDGMNLVAKEYVAAQDPEDPGVLILSRFAGAADECSSALLVNPYDPERVASSIARALAMPLAERRQRFDALYRTIAGNDVNVWGERFLDALTGAAGAAARRPTGLPLEVGHSRHLRAVTAFVQRRVARPLSSGPS